MAGQAPGTTFILDHCGGHQGLKGTCPEQGPTDAAQRQLYKDGIVACAACPNMVAKVTKSELPSPPRCCCCCTLMAA